MTQQLTAAWLEMATDARTLRRFFAKVALNGTCWEWQAFVGKRDGYGRFHVLNKPRLAHRISWQLLRGPIAPGLQVDHLCKNRRCVNPSHLEPVTAHINVMRSDSPRLTSLRAAAVTHCPYGHEYTPQNTYVSPVNTRRCRVCQRASVSRAHYRNRAARLALVAEMEASDGVSTAD